MRTKPSSKAREISYSVIWKLTKALYKLGVIAWPEDSLDEKELFEAPDIQDILGYMNSKEYVMRHTPPDKRGGPSNH